MSLTPDYGETPVLEDHLDDLLPAIRDLMGESPTSAVVYDLEQGIQRSVSQEVVADVLAGRRVVDDLLTDHYVRDLHARLYRPIWSWAGKFRRRELNIGVAPEQIAVELRTSLDGIRHRWVSTSDWTARQLGIAVHAEVVRIHPFTDGNGRTTRLLADLVFLVAQDGPGRQQYDWDLDKQGYITSLRAYDRHRDPHVIIRVCTGNGVTGRRQAGVSARKVRL